MTKKITAILIAFVAIFGITATTQCEAGMLSARTAQTAQSQQAPKGTQLFGPTAGVKQGSATTAEFLQGEKVNYNVQGEYNIDDTKFVTIDVLYNSTAKPVSWYTARTAKDGGELLFSHTCMGMHVGTVDIYGDDILMSGYNLLKNELLKSGLNGNLIRLERIPLDEIPDEEIAIYGAFMKTDHLRVYRVIISYEINPMQTQNQMAQTIQSAPQPQVVIKDNPVENIDRVLNILDRFGVNTRIFNRDRY